MNCLCCELHTACKGDWSNIASLFESQNIPWNKIKEVKITILLVCVVMSVVVLGLQGKGKKNKFIKKCITNLRTLAIKLSGRIERHTKLIIMKRRWGSILKIHSNMIHLMDLMRRKSIFLPIQVNLFNSRVCFYPSYFWID